MSMKYIEEMSRKGISYKKYNSEFGAKILGKFGWKEGEGLGKTKNGITEAIQIKRREENMGLGKTQKKVVYNDKWWENSYDKILKEMKTVKNEDNGYNFIRAHCLLAGNYVCKTAIRKKLFIYFKNFLFIIN